MASARSSGAAAGQLGSLYNLGAAGSLTDGQLLERFLARDDPAASEAAFTALVDRHGAMVLGVCRRELGDPHDAHDAFQATFLVLVSKAAAVRHWETVGGWLVGIARRVAARARVEGARRRRHLEQLGVERAALGDGSSTRQPTEAEPDYAPLLAEVARLPERFRAPVVLHYFEGLSTEATAQRLGCARGTVLSRLSRARDRLKDRLERRGACHPPCSSRPATPSRDGCRPRRCPPGWRRGRSGPPARSAWPARRSRASCRRRRPALAPRGPHAGAVAARCGRGVDPPRRGRRLDRPGRDARSRTRSRSGPGRRRHGEAAAPCRKLGSPAVRRTPRPSRWSSAARSSIRTGSRPRVPRSC